MCDILFINQHYSTKQCPTKHFKCVLITLVGLISTRLNMIQFYNIKRNN